MLTSVTLHDTESMTTEGRIKTTPENDDETAFGYELEPSPTLAVDVEPIPVYKTPSTVVLLIISDQKHFFFLMNFGVKNVNFTSPS